MGESHQIVQEHVLIIFQPKIIFKKNYRNPKKNKRSHYCNVKKTIKYYLNGIILSLYVVQLTVLITNE